RALRDERVRLLHRLPDRPVQLPAGRSLAGRAGGAGGRLRAAADRVSWRRRGQGTGAGVYRGHGPKAGGWLRLNVVLLVVAIVAALVSIALAAWALRKQRRILQDLTASRERYMLLAECTNDGTWEFDVARRRFDFSRRLYKLLGYDEGTLNTPEDLQRVISPEDYPRSREEIYAHMQARRTDELQRVMRMRTGDGRVLTVIARSVVQYAENGTPVRVLGSYTDITKRLRDERQLQIAASVFDAGSDGILISDALQRIVSVNSAFMRVTGYQREELTGRPVRDMQIPSAATRAC